MAAGPQKGEATVGSDAPREKGKATPDTLKTGCIAWVEKNGQPRRAEILSIKTTKSGKHFYCNFDNFNKRLDEWVPLSRIDLEQDVEWPKPEEAKPKDSKTKKATEKKAQVSKKAQKRPGKRDQSAAASEAATPRTTTGASLHAVVAVQRMLETNTVQSSLPSYRKDASQYPWAPMATPKAAIVKRPVRHQRPRTTRTRMARRRRMASTASRRLRS